jgi:serine/threonine protein kinase
MQKVLTEYLSLGLDKLVYNIHDTKTFNTTATRQTPLGRLRLALNVARGVAAIHDIPGGPIMHADIQAKQFLVDSQGIVKLNDFNRCRFMANNTATGAPCPLRIPSAPGSCRSPEEYNFDELTERLDMYSTAHILYAILTGEKAWEELWGTQIKKLVKEGSKPLIDKQYLTLGTSDAALANLIDLAYELDPQDRIQASKLVSELERLVSVEEAKQIGNH